MAQRSKTSMKAFKDVQLPTNGVNSITATDHRDVLEDLCDSVVFIEDGGSLSGLTAATATNDINNADFQQNWRWNSLSGVGMSLISNSTAAASSEQTLLNISTFGTNANDSETTWGLNVNNTHDGTSSTNIGAQFSASGGTNNYALVTSGVGLVGIGTATPTALTRLDVWGINGGTNIARFAKDGGSTEVLSIKELGFVQQTRNAIANTISTGLSLVNSTAAATGTSNQQWSPALILEGQGWKTAATAASQSVKWAIYTLPIEGVSSPSSELSFASSINGAAYGSRAMSLIGDNQVKMFPDAGGGLTMYFATTGIQLGSGGAAINGILEGFANLYSNTTVTVRTTDVSGAGASSDVILRTGTTATGTTGHAYVSAGIPSGAGTKGNVGLHVYSTPTSWQTMEGGLFNRDVVTAPTGNPTTGLFAWSSVEPEGSNLKIRTSGGHFAKPILQAKVTIAGGATLRAIGSAPQTIIAAPGANKYINVISATFSYNYATAVYDFGGSEAPLLYLATATTGGISLATTRINAAVDSNTKGLLFASGFIDLPSNQALLLGTADAGDATTGDGDLDVVVYYTIEDANV